MVHVVVNTLGPVGKWEFDMDSWPIVYGGDMKTRSFTDTQGVIHEFNGLNVVHIGYYPVPEVK